MNVEDRFGDYGFVGLALYRVLDGVLDVDTFLLSCRALGRGVEHRILAQLALAGLKAGCARMRLTHIQTAQNDSARQFLFAVAGSDALSVRIECGVVHSIVFLLATP